MRAILVHMTDSPAAENRLQTGLEIARRVDGHLTLHVGALVAAVFEVAPFVGGFPLTEIIDQETAATEALVTDLAARLIHEDVPFDISRNDIDTAEALSIAGRLSDLIIVDLDDNTTAGRSQASIIGDLATAATAPLLGLRPGVSIRFDGTAMVAWNGSAQAASALRAAVPLLKLFGSVCVVCIGEPEANGSATLALEYLSRHDIHAELRSVEKGSSTVEEAIEREAHSLNAALVVMGAYGHSRAREFFFGGVTRHMLDSARFPLLLTH